MAGRSYRRLKLVPHRATSEVLAGAYPFLAEEGLGSAGMLIGQDAWSGAAFCYDPWELYRQGALTNPNICLAGQIGRGKSTWQSLSPLAASPSGGACTSRATRRASGPW